MVWPEGAMDRRARDEKKPEDRRTSFRLKDVVRRLAKKDRDTRRA